MEDVGPNRRRASEYPVGTYFHWFQHCEQSIAMKQSTPWGGTDWVDWPHGGHSQGDGSIDRIVARDEIAYFSFENAP